MNGLSLEKLLLMMGGKGVAPYGLREGSGMPKGLGFLGPVMGREGVSTELSAEDESGEYPLMVPTLTKKELDLLLSGKKIPDELYNKARMFAESRRKMGKSPFATPQDIRMPAGLLD